MKDFLKLIGLITAIFLFALLVDQITPLKQLDAYLKVHPQPWTGLTLGAAAVGFGLLLFAWISWGMLTGRRMSEEEAQAFMSTSAGAPTLHRGLRGKATGVETPEGSASFHAVKDAFRTGAWLHDPFMRVFCFGTVGLLLLTLGGFGYFVVTAPPTAKLICAGALLYAFARTAWGFWKA
jgi:hypothetical protein